MQVSKRSHWSGYPEVVFCKRLFIFLFAWEHFSFLWHEKIVNGIGSLFSPGCGAVHAPRIFVIFILTICAAMILDTSIPSSYMSKRLMGKEDSVDFCNHFHYYVNNVAFKSTIFEKKLTRTINSLFWHWLVRGTARPLAFRLQI